MQKGFILQLVFVCIHSQGYNSNSESSVGFEPIWIQSHAARFSIFVPFSGNLSSANCLNCGLLSGIKD